MATLKDKFDKAKQEVHSGVADAKKDIKHQFKDNEDVPAAEASKEAEHGTLWQSIKDTVGLGGESAPEHPDESL